MVLAALSAPALAATDITLDVTMAFPESLTSTRQWHGLYRQHEPGRGLSCAMPGESTAKPFITKEAGNFGRVLGVLADARSDTLWLCDNNGDHASL